MKWLLGFLSIALLPSLVFAGVAVIELEPMKDATLYGEIPGEHSNGSGQHFFVGTNAVGGPYRSVMAFDVAGNVPAGSIIEDVTLTCFMSRTIVGPFPITLHVVESDWGEGPSDPDGEEGGGQFPPDPGDCTWLHTFYPDQLWNSAGGDFTPVASAMQMVGDNGFYSWNDPAMAADVQFWLDNPGDNYGWLFLGDEVTVPTAKRFDSREVGDPAITPKLEIVYTEQPTPVESTTWGKIKALY